MKSISTMIIELPYIKQANSDPQFGGYIIGENPTAVSAVVITMVLYGLTLNTVDQLSRHPITFEQAAYIMHLYNRVRSEPHIISALLRRKLGVNI